MDESKGLNISRIIHTPQKLVTDKDREIYETVNFVFIMASICIFGVVANVINILVFYKQGFNNTMNISFFGLAISDMGSLLGLLWSSVCANPLFVRSETPLYPLEIVHLTGGIPHICFARITSWITVFITLERCLCIILPLKIKRIITPNVTIGTVSAIYIITIMSFLPEYATCYYGWKFFPTRNKTLLGLVYTSHRHNVEGLVFFLFAIQGSASFIAVIVFTFVLVVQLHKTTIWRRKANAEKYRSEAISSRDRRTMNMVVLIASILIACYAPGVAVSLASFLRPEFSIVGVYVNLFYITWSFVFIFEAINSSVNVFLYYKMSTKYRGTFLAMFGFAKLPEQHN